MRPIIRRKRALGALLVILAVLFVVCRAASARAEMLDFPVVKLRALDKVSAHTMTFEATVGSIVKFGPLYIKTQSCRKAPPTEKPEAASFLQVWEVTEKGKSQWVFSGWMFSSSPALSSMDHPVYDVWVLDCLEHKSDQPPADAAKDKEKKPVPSDEGEASDSEMEE